MERLNGGIKFLVWKEAEGLGGNNGWWQVSRRKLNRMKSAREETVVWGWKINVWERICTVGCCFASIMQITCMCCAMFICFAGLVEEGWLLPTLTLQPLQEETMSFPQLCWHHWLSAPKLKTQMNRAALMAAELNKQLSDKKTPNTNNRTATTKT